MSLFHSKARRAWPGGRAEQPPQTGLEGRVEKAERTPSGPEIHTETVGLAGTDWEAIEQQKKGQRRHWDC